MYTITLDKFSGPYKVLLDLIEKKNLEITEISLAQVTDQFLKYIDQHSISEEELASFLIVASKLLYIKSRAILPKPEEDEPDYDELSRHLKMYKKYLEASEVLHKYIADEKMYSFARNKYVPPKKIEFEPPYSIGFDDYPIILRKILRKLKPVVKLPKTYIDKVVSLQKRVKDLRAFIAQIKKYSFTDMVKESHTGKADIIVSFLALLELSKAQEINITQEDNFSHIHIEKS